MFDNTKKMPSPGRQTTQHKIQPHPEEKDGPVETWRSTGKLRPNEAREVVCYMTRILDTRVHSEAMIIENELETE